MSNQTEVIIGLGSNINANHNIPKAVDELQLLGDLLQMSEVMVTAPIGITDQEDFSNAVVLMRITNSYEALNAALKAIEDKMGRDRTRPKFGPREIDLDIVMFDHEIVDDDYYSRAFLQTLVAQVWVKK